MPANKPKKSLDTNTESRIKTAARIVFHKKGFAATRTRDIAEEAGLNLALLNYYFRSKEKLFELVMLETLSAFLLNLGTVVNDPATTLEKKIELIAAKYIDTFALEPEIPLFIMSELRSHGADIFDKLPTASTILQSVLIRQFKESVRGGKIAEANPLHFLMNTMGLIIFPFVASPMLKKIAALSDTQFDKLMQERKKLIPVWIKAAMKAK
jgi:AcrR family transcriptional regulator